MSQTLNKDIIHEILIKLDYPDIRRFCLVGKHYLDVCVQDENSLIEKKLHLHVDSILSNMILAEGYLNSDNMVVNSGSIPGRYIGSKKYIAQTYKECTLNSPIPNHTFKLWDNYDPKVDYDYYNKRSGPHTSLRFKYEETRSSYIFCADSYRKPAWPDWPYTKHLYFNYQDVRQLLATLLKRGCIQ